MPLRGNRLIAAVRGHTPLLVCTLGSLGLTVVTLAGLLLDDRVLTGAPIWLKPFKFGVSTAVYAATLAWLISYVQRGRRLARVTGTVFSAMMLGELALITTQVVRGTTSHFNYQTPLDSAIWRAMAIMIVGAWLSNLVIAVMLLRQRIADRPMASALRLGLGVALVGMAVAFFMTTPPLGVTEAASNGIIGAHTVGAADGGPGLLITGWSTVGGDLRVPHFFGIHALQGLPLFVLVLGLLAERFHRLRDERIRLRLTRVAGLAYLGLVVLTTWQAIRGQSLIRPDTTTLLAATILCTAAAIGAAWALRARHDRAAPPPPQPSGTPSPRQTDHVTTGG